MIADLHIHTTFSDGTFSPEKVVDLAAKKGLDALAITDHDTILGIEPAVSRSKKYSNFHIIPGIEFSCVHLDEEVHILGYFIDYHSSVIIDITNKLKQERINRTINILEKLKKVNINVSYDEVKKFAKKDFIGRPHIAKVLVQKKYVRDIDEAFDLYLERGKPCYAEKYRLSLQNCIELIHDVDGIAILAHPGLIKKSEVIFDTIKMKVDGIEVIHSKHGTKEFNYFNNLCNEYNLIKTGGSDFHGKKSRKKYLLGEYYVNLDYIPKMKGRMKLE